MAVHARHAQVEQRDVRAELADRLLRAEAVRGLAHDGEPRIALQRADDPGAKERVVVGHHDAQGTAHVGATWPRSISRSIFVERQRDAQRPGVDRQAEDGDGEHVPPEREPRVRGRAEVAQVHDQAHADEVDRQPQGGARRRTAASSGSASAPGSRRGSRSRSGSRRRASSRSSSPTTGSAGWRRRTTAGASTRAAGSRYGPLGVRQAVAEDAEGQRRAGVHEHARARDQADERLPARERQEADAADHEGGDEAEPRDPARGRCARRSSARSRCG